MFAVKFGDDQELLFNSDCKIKHLLQNIRERCCCRSDNTELSLTLDTVDLSDETGDVRHLSKNPDNNASTLVKQRETLLLIRVQQGISHEFPVYIPLLKSKEKDFDYIANLNRKSITARRDSIHSKGRRMSQAMDLWSRGVAFGPGIDGDRSSFTPPTSSGYASRRSTSLLQQQAPHPHHHGPASGRRSSTFVGKTSRSISVY